MGSADAAVAGAQRVNAAATLPAALPTTLTTARTATASPVAASALAERIDAGAQGVRFAWPGSTASAAFAAACLLVATRRAFGAGVKWLVAALSGFVRSSAGLTVLG